MLKLIPLLLSLTLLGAGGVAISTQKNANKMTGENVATYLQLQNTSNYDFQKSQDLFLKADTIPNL